MRRKNCSRENSRKTSCEVPFLHIELRMTNENRWSENLELGENRPTAPPPGPEEKPCAGESGPSQNGSGDATRSLCVTGILFLTEFFPLGWQRGKLAQRKVPVAYTSPLPLPLVIVPKKKPVKNVEAGIR